MAVRNPLLRMENREKMMKYARTGLTVIVEDEYRLEILAQTLVSIYRGEYSQSCLKYSGLRSSRWTQVWSEFGPACGHIWEVPGNSFIFHDPSHTTYTGY